MCGVGAGEKEINRDSECELWFHWKCQHLDKISLEGFDSFSSIIVYKTISW